MSVRSPHYLLFSEVRRLRNRPDWHFVIEAADGSAKFEAADSEPHTRGERLELLAVVRGLEALDQPSQVTIYTPSRYVHRGLRFGLPEWRSSGWQWERYGQMVPVKDRDLWRRVDRALQYHQVDCRTCQADGAHTAHAAHTAEGVVPAPHVAAWVGATRQSPSRPPAFSTHPLVEDLRRGLLYFKRLGARGAWRALVRRLRGGLANWRNRSWQDWASQLRDGRPTQLLLGEPTSD